MSGARVRSEVSTAWKDSLSRCILVVLAFSSPSAVGLADESDSHFENHIRPILSQTCFRCHGGTKTSAGLRVDSRESLLAGGESGPAIVPGRPESSLLMRAIRRKDDVSAMPPEHAEALKPEQIAAFEMWVRQGAEWPAKSVAFERSGHWAFKPVHAPEPPGLRDSDGVRNDIDRFIRAHQENSGTRILRSDPADKRTLIRRATFDLTGLPPTWQDVQTFVEDTSETAFERVLDRLLASPHYGERWGRHWLDVVRYADTAGETADYPVPLAWRYRNYVIDAFNNDKPYDQFLREQIAGDILANQAPADRYAEQVTATGYLAISRRFGFDSENYHHLTIQDTIDTLGQSVLGLSLGCARCHDHKFDDLTMEDYYALYGIFDSSRYAFPGSEQKQRVRSMVPLVPPSESQQKWRDYEYQVAVLRTTLEQQQKSAPASILKSLHDMDGDFELQAPAAGGSNGVLVPPWTYSGPIAVTTTAQSPFRNVFPGGKVGASIAAGTDKYRIAQAIHPARSADNCQTVSVNLDFRISAVDESTSGQHRLLIGTKDRNSDVLSVADILISRDRVMLRSNEQIRDLASLPPNEWQNIQLNFDLSAGKISGTIGLPGQLTAFRDIALTPGRFGPIEWVVLESAEIEDARRPAIEFDNLAVREQPFSPVNSELSSGSSTDGIQDFARLTQQYQQLIGTEGDFELQTENSSPGSPWNPGPNSVVKISRSAQSPFRNLFSAGELGIHLPNRSEYDGFGLTLPQTWTAETTEQLFAGFDFCCSDVTAGGDGSWRYYIGHGPGNSAALELFFNGTEFFRRSGSQTESVCPLIPGEWYQVQLTLDLKARTFRGAIASTAASVEFSGLLATGWDGSIDYSFIDSYGHRGGVRPALDADNYVVRTSQLPAFGSVLADESGQLQESRRVQATEIRRQLAELQKEAENSSRQLNALLANGPVPMTYGMSEGTPHNVRIHQRGEPEQPGNEVARGFPAALGGGPLSADTVGSGRLELAHWLTLPENPLTARVMVNRIWQYHFGRGLVETSNDFGVRGLPPTHPELLDYLAAEFVRSGWSIKSMHRIIMRSATYQQASVTAEGDSAASDSLVSRDLYSRSDRRRLSAEEIRDAILLVSGEWDPTPAEAHPFPSPITWGFTQHGPFNAVYEHNKRSVYLMTQRLKRHPFLALFDGPDPNATTATRLGTTVPTQALFFLNDPFVHSKADAWAARLQAVSSDDQSQINRAFQDALARNPTSEEVADGVEFLTLYRQQLAELGQEDIPRSALAAFLRTIIGSNEFLYVD